MKKIIKNIMFLILLTIFNKSILAKELDSCLTRDPSATKFEKSIIYNLKGKNSKCFLLKNLDGPNKLSKDLEVNMSGIPCSVNTDTDSNLSKYKDTINKINTQIINNSTITINCKPNYSYVNNSKRTVTCNNGVLTYNFLGCKLEDKDCITLPTPPTVENGTVSYYLSTDSSKSSIPTVGIEFKPDTVIVSKLECNSGYVPKLDNIDYNYTCQSNGLYTTTQIGELTCEMQTCNTLPTIPTVENGTVSYYLSTDNTKTDLTSSSVIQPTDVIVSKLSCNSGYAPKYNAEGDQKKYTCQGGTYTETQVGKLECMIPFHITVKTTSSNQSFTFKFNTNTNNGSTQDCTIDWGDGTSDPCPATYNSSKGHTYTTAKEYDLKISGRTFIGLFNDTNASSGMITKLHSYGKWENNIVYMGYVFAKSGLTYIHSEAFKHLPNVISFKDIFQYSNSITSIPADLFRYNTKVINFQSTFLNCSSIKSIPVDLFRYNPNVSNFSFIFSDCSSLTSIPVDLFRYNPNVSDFRYIFRGCTSLSSIPTDLFRYNTNVYDFSYTFSGCTSLKCSDIDGGGTETVVNHPTWPKWRTSGGAVMSGAKIGCRR